MFEYCWFDGNPPLRITANEIGNTEEELVALLLCEKCENLLNHDGENWLLPKLAQRNGPFPFYDLVVKGPADIIQPGYAAYACSKNDQIAFRKLTNFALGVFWKASVHSWREGKSDPQIELGKYREPFRRFLNHEATFPRDTHLHVVVTPPDRAAIAFNLPELKKKKPYHLYIFYIPGIVFILGVGKQMEEDWKPMCFYSNHLHPIIVADVSERIFQALRSGSKSAVRVERASPLLPRRKKT